MKYIANYKCDFSMPDFNGYKIDLLTEINQIHPCEVLFWNNNFQFTNKLLEYFPNLKNVFQLVVTFDRFLFYET